ncbi:hypothetical protein [Sphingomonas profundi]|uniref:hypothetical protein n=1 Tax=Alterirhizorhabdus profundi TaxID=2681549 RepID=UPI0012E8204D|nr:hypothetical protein [Sphingomonas profundi]
MTPLLLGIRIAAADRPLLIAAAEQLGEALADPGEPPWPVTLRAVGDEAPPTPPPSIVIATMRAALDGGEDAAALAAGLARLTEAGAAVLLCTLLRVVADRAARPALMPRIRALNLRAVELSHALGLAVIDVDRVLSLFGAARLQTDYRLGGPAADEVAAHVIVSALLAGGLDAMVPADRQERALARHGDLHAIAGIVDRRLRAKAAGARGGR